MKLFIKASLSLLILTSIFFGSCNMFSEKKLLLGEVVKAKNGLYYHTGKLFSGILFDLYPNNKIKIEFHVKNGLKDGKYIELSESGDTTFSGFFLKGLKDGKCETRKSFNNPYAFGDTISSILRENYSNGRLDGEYQFIETREFGLLISETLGSYKKGIKFGNWEHYFNGTLVYYENMESKRAIISDSTSTQDVYNEYFVFSQDSTGSSGMYKLIINKQFIGAYKYPITIQYYYDNKLIDERFGILSKGKIEVNSYIEGASIVSDSEYKFSLENELCVENPENGLYDCYIYIPKKSKGNPMSYFYKVRLLGDRYYINY